MNVMVIAKAIEASATVLSKSIDALTAWVTGAERRRMRKGMEIGEKMALRIKELNVGDNALDKLADKFFKYNN